MKSREEKISQLRKKDLISIFITTIASALIFVFIKGYFAGSSEAVMFSYIGIVGGVIAVIMSYFESKNNDPFVTGKTQTFGVMNSFIAAGVVIILASFKFGLIPTLIVVDVLIILFRELGRNARQKMVDKYVNKVGKIVKDSGNGKYVMDMNSENVSVYSKDKLLVGSSVKVSELKGTYLYVEKVA